MTTLAALIWVYCLSLFPITSLVTLTTTFVICNVITNDTSNNDKPLDVFRLNENEGYAFNIAGFVMLFIQFSVIILGRLQYLFQTQLIVSRIVILFLHLIGFISWIFMLIISFIPIDNSLILHQISINGMFGCFTFYCVIHTIVIIYLYLHRIDAPQYSNVIYSIWFGIWTLGIVVVFVMKFFINHKIWGYILFYSPCFYFLGFIPQFWSRAIQRKRDSIGPAIHFFNNDSDV